MKSLVLFFCLYLVFGIGSAIAQSAIDMSQNPKYAEVVRLINDSKHQSDSVKNILALLKDSVKSNPSMRSVMIKSILDLEGRVFELENKMAKYQTKKTLMDHEFISDRVNSSEEMVTNFSSANDILKLGVIKDNFSKDELGVLILERGLDGRYEDYGTRSKAIYTQIDTLLFELRLPSVDVRRADSLSVKIDSLMAVNSSEEHKFDDVWRKVFDTKTYVYSRLLDKLNISVSEMANLADKARRIRADITELQGKLFSPKVYTYPQERVLAMEYELILARKLGALNIIDSINIAMKSTIAKSGLKSVIRPNYEYAKYESIKINKGYVVKDEDIRPIIVPTVGQIYSIRVVTLTNKLSATSSIRRLEPMYKFVNDKDQTEYYTGVYRTKEESASDFKRLVSLGYKPSVVEFKDGGKVMANGSIYPVDASVYLYTLEFTQMDEQLENKLKELSPNKQITVVNNLYTFGVFDTYNEIQAVQKELSVASKIIKIER